MQSISESSGDPVLASIVLLNGGSSASKRIPGKTRPHIFSHRAGAGIHGKNAHVREYTSLEEFHKDQTDLAQSLVRLPFVVRLYAIDPIQAAKSSVAAFVKFLHNAPSKLKHAQEIREVLDKEIARLTALTEAPPEEEGEPAEPPAEIDRSPRAIRAAELRRSGEEFVRHTLRDLYQIEGVATLNNLDGMITAILDQEEGMGLFEPQSPAASAPEAPAASTEPATTPAASGGRPTAEVLSQMPIDELKALASKLNCRTGNRRTMVHDILAAQGK